MTKYRTLVTYLLAAVMFASFSQPSSAGGARTLALVRQNGTAVMVPDFTTTNQPSWASAEAGYQVAGSNTGPFQIIYTPPQRGGWSYINIVLTAQPLSTDRTAAEKILRVKLGLSKKEMCTLDIQVHANPGMAPAYAGRNLGLSYCPHAVPLPVR